MLLLRHISTFTLLLIGIVRLAGQSVSLTADNVEGCDSIDVHFTDTSDLGGETLDHYTWYFGDGTSIQNNSLTATKRYNIPGVYNARLVMKLIDDDNLYSDTVQVFIHPRPNAFFFVVDTFRLGGLTYRFLSGKAPVDTITYRYIWTLNPGDNNTFDYRKTHPSANCITSGPGAGFTNRDSLLYRFSQVGPNVMRLMAIDHFGCVDSFQQRFIVTDRLLIPKAFTPNGDNVNDFFMVKTNGRSVFSFKVFSITGQLVFKSESPSIIWDGNMINGAPAWPGTYLYIIESISGESVKKETGFFMLLKERK